MFAVMCSDGTVLNSQNKPFYDVRHGWCCGGGFGDIRFVSGAIAKNWCHTILSSKEYFHLYPAPDADGWIDWGGGECPVEAESLVDYKLLCGEVCCDGEPAGYAGWHHAYGDSNIIAYRLHKPEKKAISSDDANLTITVDGVEREITPFPATGGCVTPHIIHLPEGKADLCKSVMRSIPEPEAKPTIEQLAADYRNQLDFARRKQEEADCAKADADESLRKL
ncbi:MAG: hypothetical protein ACRDBQ_15125 [Shewanella sp.]